MVMGRAPPRAEVYDGCATLEVELATILVVEDDRVSARMMQDFLSAHGYETSVARTGPQGVERFHDLDPDLMIVDVALPKKNGFEVCFEVKRTEMQYRGVSRGLLRP